METERQINSETGAHLSGLNPLLDGVRKDAGPYMGFSPADAERDQPEYAAALHAGTAQLSITQLKSQDPPVRNLVPMQSYLQALSE